MFYKVTEKVIFFNQIFTEFLTISNEGLSYFDCILFFSQILGEINKMVDIYLYIKIK